MPGGAGPFQNYPADGPLHLRRKLMQWEYGRAGPAWLRPYAFSTKFLGYGIYSTPVAAASASKMLGYGVIATPLNTAVASKLLGYAILEAIPARPQHIVNELVQARRRQWQTYDIGLNLNQPIPPPAIPFIPREFTLPRRRRAVYGSDGGTNLCLYGTSTVPFFGIETPVPPARRRAVRGEITVSLCLGGTSIFTTPAVLFVIT